MRIRIALGMVLLIGAGAAYWLISAPPEQAPAVAAEIAEPAVPILERKPPRTPPAGFREYRSEFNWFQLFYPEELSVKEYEEAGSARTITFSGPGGEAAFQIFIVPYGGAVITEARFKKDVPSGVIEGLEAITMDGASGISFTSRHPQLGETREVWLIARGFLYEITSPRTLEQWLSELLSSWQFL